jgi:RNA 2',3'-cyclic 3'-phosphodiesterase
LAPLRELLVFLEYPEQMAKTRTFIGIDISGDTRDAATDLQEALAKTGARVKWVEPENMHVTLLFLGDIDDRELVAVCRAVKEVAAREAPFSLSVSGLGAFPNLRRPKVLWVGIKDGTEPLHRLNAALEERMLDLNVYRQEEHGYTPHLTLGRVSDAGSGTTAAGEMQKHLAWDGGRTAVGEVVVYSSEMERSGPVYRVLGRAPLTGRPG